MYAFFLFFSPSALFYFCYCRIHMVARGEAGEVVVMRRRGDGGGGGVKMSRWWGKRWWRRPVQCWWRGLLWLATLPHIFPSWNSAILVQITLPGCHCNNLVRRASLFFVLQMHRVGGWLAVSRRGSSMDDRNCKWCFHVRNWGEYTQRVLLGSHPCFNESSAEMMRGKLFLSGEGNVLVEGLVSLR